MQNQHAPLHELRLLICDVDGVLTNGQFTYLNDGSEIKFFHVHDGLGLQRLQAAGMAIAWISGRTSDIVARRAKELNIEHVYQGIHNKLPPFKALLKHYQITEQQVAYIGDDLPDHPIMQRVGLAISVANATPTLSDLAHWQTQHAGGHGAVREACERIIAGRHQ